MKDTEVLDQMYAELSKPEGWVKSTYGEVNSPNGPVCLIGSLQRVRYANKLSEARYNSVFNRLAKAVELRAGTSSPIGYNDAAGRTLEDVLVVIKHAKSITL